MLQAVRVLDEHYKEFCNEFDENDGSSEGTTYKQGINIEFYIEADLWHDVSLALRKIDQGPPPYILVDQEPKRAYNPEYGDDRMCVCGHAYYRHFDSYENMEPVGCKYCNCYEFVEKVE